MTDARHIRSTAEEEYEKSIEYFDNFTYMLYNKSIGVDAHRWLLNTVPFTEITDLPLGGLTLIKA